MKKISWILSLLALCQVVETSAAPGSNQFTYRGTVLIDHSEQQPILGISSIRYDKITDEFILVSDDTGTIPNVYNKLGEARFTRVSGQAVIDALRIDEEVTLRQSFPLEPSHISEVHLKVRPDAYQWAGRKNWIKDGHIDTEGLALYRNSADSSSDLLIASEQGASYPAKTFRMQGNQDVYNMFRVPDVDVVSSLLKVDRETGYLEHRYYLPSYYQPPIFRETLAYLFPPIVNAYDWWFDDEFIGLQRNRGIESIDFIPGTNEVIAITEAPLRQDLVAWQKTIPDTPEYPPLPAPSRIIHMSLDEFTDGSQYYPVVKKELLYGVSAMPDKYTTDPTATITTGVSDVVALNSSELLVVERTRITFDKLDEETQKKVEFKKPYSVTEIYRVNLNLDKKYHVTRLARPTPEDMQAKRMVRKELMFSTLKPTEKGLFDNLNIEGITFGPEIDGKRTIVLVNDNDAGKGAFTQLIFLTVN